MIGSLAVSDPELVAAWLTEFGPERLTLALDVRLDADGTPLIATHGWTRASTLTLAAAIERYRGRRPAARAVHRHRPRRRAVGPERRAVRATACARWPAIAFQASGGVRDAADLAALAAAGVAATVSGKALLEGRLTTEEIRPFLRGA